ncbi:hypothetical protein BCR44DRAFT_23688 [Catenaria anguillulae PL171]|uniref:R3H domain-containing protein n=1 Tax=Catenaria anguillulae PL171 TaxID=765915 RepID=A0A1Y2HWZ8_9FUNG|nr:hypothetical protein BCR44DRAFT_23688 [Catenaria anguillulae PL171]
MDSPSSNSNNSTPNSANESNNNKPKRSRPPRQRQRQRKPKSNTAGPQDPPAAAGSAQDTTISSSISSASASTRPSAASTPTPSNLDSESLTAASSEQPPVKKKYQRQRKPKSNNNNSNMPATASASTAGSTSASAPGSSSAAESTSAASASNNSGSQRSQAQVCLNPNARPFVPANSGSNHNRNSRAIPIRRPPAPSSSSPLPLAATAPQKPQQVPAATTALAALNSYGHDYTSLALSLATDLILGSKECVICCDSIKPRNPIWSCSTCFVPLHLGCVKEWAASHTPPNPGGDTATGEKTMRCPACNCTQPLESARFYTCFCGQVRNPALDRFTTPHACGKPCDRTLADCTHKCSLPCHPGPCSPCAKIVTVSCAGGHVKRQATCGSEAAKAQVPCVAKCNKVLNCGKHTCERTCHAVDEDDDGDSDLAHKCTVEVLVPCQCGRSDPQPFHCGSEPAARKCNTPCDLTFPCGHTCTSTCCPLSPADHVLCPLSPELLNTCPCGKSTLNRTSCHDPTSTSCGKSCGQPLPCGHPCSRKCHSDLDNHRCTSTMQATCRCGLVTSTLPCAVYNTMLASGDPFLCELVCDAPLMCRRKGHKCKSVCCPASKAAIAASVSNVPATSASSSSALSLSGRGASNNNAWTSLESHLQQEALTATARRQLDSQFHTCPHTCGKPLTCGNHACAYPCHAGACPPCLEASFDELFCACGRSSIIPPVPCGTLAVQCSFPCTRERPCGHPNLGTHECHSDAVACPPCVVLVEKKCACGKSTMPASRCSSTVKPACGAKCGLPLACGHKCSLGCHDPNAPATPCVCREVCGQRREMTCGHACPLACHYGQGTCEEVGGGCKVKVTRSCACGRLSQVGTCQPGRNSVPLECDDGCRVAARNRVVADALKVGASRAKATGARASGSDDDGDGDGDMDDSACPYDLDTLTYARLHPDFARELEHTLADLIASAERDSRGGVAMRNLGKPMKQPVRKFVHAIAAAWHVHSESVDPEPKRLVILTAKRGLSGPPRWTCAEAVRRWVASGAMAVGTGMQVAPAAKAAAKRTPVVAAAAQSANALVIQETSLASALDVEPYCRLYFGSTPFSVVRHAPSRTDPTKYEAVVQVIVAGPSSGAAYMPPHAVQELIREVRAPLHSLLVDLGKAKAVVEAHVDRKGNVSAGAGFVKVTGKKGSAAVAQASASEEEEGEEHGESARMGSVVPVAVATRNTFESLLDLPSSPAKSSASSSSAAQEPVDDWEQEADD